MGYEADEQADSERLKIGFLDSELNLCNTLLDLARIEKDSPEDSRKAIRKAQEGFKTAQEFIGTVRDQKAYDRLSARIDELEERIRKFQP